MDKNEFQTYEYLPVSNNAEADSDQFFVIQEDGNFLLNRQVQLVAEVQDANEAIDGTQCAAYDVNPQQFFVDDGCTNPAELISVADNYILPSQIPGEVNNLYSNSFLLQPVDTEIQDTETSDQADKDLSITVQLKEVKRQEEGVVNIVDKQGSSCTEITLSDEQYSSLEQKGWVLIESNGKIFILDALGLHEVTTNNDFKNLKIELPVEFDPTGLTKDNHSQQFNVENIIIHNPTLQQDTFDSPIKYEGSDNENKLNVAEEEVDSEDQQKVVVQEDNPSDVKKYSNEDKKEAIIYPEPQTLNNSKIKILTKYSFKVNTENQQKAVVQKDNTSDVKNDPNKDKKEAIIYPEPQTFNNSKIKILTKYSFKDIPEKIFLGKTRNGKRLIAKVVKRTDSVGNIKHCEEVKSYGVALEQPKRPNILKKKEGPSKATPIRTDISDEEFSSLVRRATAGELRCSSSEAVDASDVITQLFQVPEFSASVAGRNLIITRVTERASADGEPRISFVSGFVKSAEDGGLLFIHVPHLLQKLTHEYEEHFRKQSSRSVLKPIPEKAPDCKIIQVHISETKHNGIQAISFILNERSVLSTLSGQIDSRVDCKKFNKLHACSTCAAIFQSEAEVADHQENHAIDSDGALTIDTDKLPKDVKTYTIMENRYYVVNTEKGSEYCCFQCTSRFNKLANCIRHMKMTHPRATTTKPGEDSEPRAEAGEASTRDVKCENDLENEDFVVKSVDPPDAPYKCKMCSCAYYYAASLSKHISKAHIMDKVNTMIQTNSENQSGA